MLWPTLWLVYTTFPMSLRCWSHEEQTCRKGDLRAQNGLHRALWLAVSWWNAPWELKSICLDAELTSLLQQDDEQTRQHLQDLCHDDGWRREEAIAWQRADVSDAEDEWCILDHQHGEADVLQPPVNCRTKEPTHTNPRGDTDVRCCWLSGASSGPPETRREGLMKELNVSLWQILR